MNAPTGSRRQLHIDRLELDLRGIAPDTAQAAARALGPALQRALASSLDVVHSMPRIDAGRISTGTAPGAGGLAADIAQRIATRVRGEGA